MPKNRSPLVYIVDRQASQIALSTLAAETAISLNDGPALEEDFFGVFFEAAIRVDGFTTGEGPVAIVLSEGGLSAAMVAQALIDDGPVDPADVTEREYHTRATWLLGVFNEDGLVKNGDNGLLRYDFPGRGWMFSSDAEWTLWALSMSAAALTAGTTIKVWSRMWGRWRQ